MDEKMRNEVNKHYSEIASRIKMGGSCDCGSGCCSGRNSEYAQTLYEEEPLGEIPEKARTASLGCANPLLVANLQPGEVVLDLGSGGGIDVFLAAREVGTGGRVYGLDMSDEMLELARMNQQEMNITNVEFIKGYLEDIPLADHSVDVIMSNCVINLSTDKERVMGEMIRVLKPGGRLAIADIIKLAPVDPEREKELALWVSCVAGTLVVDDYIQLLKRAGFIAVNIEPLFVYNREHLRTMVTEGSEAMDFGELDGCYAGGLVSARRPTYRVRQAVSEDMETITTIYNQALTEHKASLDTCMRSVENMAAWVSDHQIPYKVLVLEDSQEKVVAWGSLNEFTSRCCAQGVADVSLYVAREARQQGWGHIMARELESEAKRLGLHKLVASCLSTNSSPITLAMGSGYRLVGSYQNQGQIDGKWVDLVLIEKLLGQVVPPAVKSSNCCGG